MSYYVQCSDGEIFIDAAKLQACAEEIVKAYKEAAYDFNTSWLEGRPHRTFQEVCEAFEFNPDYDEEGNVTDLYLGRFNAVRVDESVYANALAKYAEEGSWLQFTGEEGDIWRYYFVNGKAVRKEPKWE